MTPGELPRLSEVCIHFSDTALDWSDQVGAK
jgi:hypothetical protein